eukprot:2833395-Heterocapsa_arctica.AAC.1
MAPPQDNTEGFAITEERRTTQFKLNRMRKYKMLVNKKTGAPRGRADFALQVGRKDRSGSLARD